MNLQEAFDTGFVAVKEYIDAIEKKFADRMNAIEKLIAEIEASGLRYQGTWQRAADYRRGAVVTHSGSMWCAIRDNRDTTPGTSDAWQLAVKAGKDAAR